MLFSLHTGGTTAGQWLIKDELKVLVTSDLQDCVYEGVDVSLCVCVHLCLCLPLCVCACIPVCVGWDVCIPVCEGCVCVCVLMSACMCLYVCTCARVSRWVCAQVCMLPHESSCSVWLLILSGVQRPCPEKVLHPQEWGFLLLADFMRVCVRVLTLISPLSPRAST